MLKRYLIIGSLLLLIIIPLALLLFDHDSGPDLGTGPELNAASETEQQFKQQEREREQWRPLIGTQQKDQLLAEDLSQTTSLFLYQVSQQLQKWAELDLSTPKLKSQFEEELDEHRHIEGYALWKDGAPLFSKGDMVEENILPLLQENKEKVYSDPYQKDEQQYMAMAIRKNDQEWVVGEINLSFIKKYVGHLASVADANGNLFISGKKSDVDIEEGEKKSSHHASQRVPELGWQISVQSQPEQTEEKHYHEGEAVVLLDEQISPDQWLVQHPGYSIKKNDAPYLIVKHPSMKVDQLVKELRADPNIRSAEPNYMYTKQVEKKSPSAQFEEISDQVPNDEFFAPYQWNLRQIFAQMGWQFTGGSEEIIIAVLDTGIDSEHDDLAAKVITGYNAFTGTDDVRDDHGHGTHVAGIAAAVTNNYSGIAGVSWRNPIMPIKVLDQEGTGSLYEIASGLRWAVDHGAKVVNMSLGDIQHAAMLEDAIRYAFEHDVVLVAAAGNDNVSDPMYPAAYDETLSVAAVDNQLEKASFSNYGEHMDVTAPGEHIPSTFPDNQYVVMSGTSMAAPHVAGLAALIRSMRPELRNDEVYEIIRNTADDIGPPGVDPYHGYGQINVQHALERVSDKEYQSLEHDQQESPFGHRLLDWLVGLKNSLKSPFSV